MKKLLYLLLVVFSLSFLIGCEPQEDDKTTGGDVLTEVEGVDFSNVKFESITLTYDGLTHSILVENLPEGVSVAYAGNNVSEVGTHTVTAKFYKDNVRADTKKMFNIFITRNLLKSGLAINLFKHKEYFDEWTYQFFVNNRILPKNIDIAKHEDRMEEKVSSLFKKFEEKLHILK